MYQDNIWGIIELSPWARTVLQHPVVRPEIIRTKHLNHQSLSQHVFPGMTHTAWSNLLGTHYLSNQIEGLRTDSRAIVQSICLFMHTGHLPLGEPTERAVLRAALDCPAVASQLRTVLEPVLQSARRYKPSLNETDVVGDLFRKHKYYSLPLWLAAAKVKLLPRDINLGHRDKLLCCFIDDNSTEHFVSQYLYRVDHVLRDMYHSGLLTTRLSNESVRRLLTNSDAERDLMASLWEYVDSRVYNDPTTLGRQEVLTETLQGLLSQGELSLELLMTGTDQTIVSMLQVRGAWARIEEPTFHLVLSENIVGQGLITTSREQPDIPQVRNTMLEGVLAEPGGISLVTRMEPPGPGKLQVTILREIGEDFSCVALARALFNLRQILIKHGSTRYQTINRDHGRVLLRECLTIDCGFDEITALGGLLVALQNSPERHRNAVTQALMDFRGERPSIPFGLVSTVAKWKEDPDTWFSLVASLLTVPDSFQQLRAVRASLATALHEMLRTNESHDELYEVIAFTYFAVRFAGQPSWVLPRATFSYNGQKYEVDVMAVVVEGERLVVYLVECSISNKVSKRDQDLRKINQLQEAWTGLHHDLEVRCMTMGRSPGSVKPEEMLANLVSDSQP